MSSTISSLTTVLLSLQQTLINTLRYPTGDGPNLEEKASPPIDVCFILEKIINPNKYLEFIKDSRHKIDLFTELDSVKQYLHKKKYDAIVLGMVLNHKGIYENEPEGNLEAGLYFLRDLREGKFGTLNTSTDVAMYTYNDDQSIRKKVEAIDPKITFLNPRNKNTFGELTRYFDNLKK